MKSTTTLQRTIRAALLAAVAGTALVTAPAAIAQNSRESRTVIHSSTGDNDARVEVRNGRYTITLNGKQVKSGTTDEAWTTFDLVNSDGESVGTITRDNDEFAINLDDEEGNPVAASSGSGSSPTNLALIERDAARARRDAVWAARDAARAAASAAPAASGDWGTPPKSMLGVTLESPGEALSSHLGINRETATLLTSVSDGLPAAKAGLKLYDVITEVNGEPASPDTLRRFLREKQPGDILALKVARGGERKDISVTLEAYDANRLNTVTMTTGAWSPGASAGGTFTINAFDNQMEEKARELEKLSQMIAEKSMAIQNAGSDTKALEALSEQMNKLGEEMNKRGEEMNRLAEQMSRANTGGWNIFPGPGGGRTIVGRRTGQGGTIDLMLPATPPPTGYLNPTNPSAAPGAAGLSPAAPVPSPDVSALTERLNKMDSQVAKLTELLERVVEQKSASAGGGSAKKDN
jgi:uncharacterized coiled-coil protein SlyX